MGRSAVSDGPPMVDGWAVCPIAIRRERASLWITRHARLNRGARDMMAGQSSPNGHRSD